MKVLPELLKSVEFGGGGPKVFASVMKIGNKLSDEEWESKITPVIVRLFSNPDRAIRVCLLDCLPGMIDHLSQKVVNDKIFPQMVEFPRASIYWFTLNRTDYGFYRRSTTGSRANRQSCFDHYHQALRSYHQRRFTKAACKNL